MEKKFFKFILSTTLMLTVLLGCNKQNESNNYYDKEEHFETILNDYYFNGKSMDFFDKNGNLITNEINSLKDDYIDDKEETLKKIVNLVDGVLKSED